MRVFNYYPETRGTEVSDGITLMMNISFTGDALAQISPDDPTINLKEWIWHEQVINGVTYCIITGKREIKA